MIQTEISSKIQEIDNKSNETFDSQSSQFIEKLEDLRIDNEGESKFVKVLLKKVYMLKQMKNEKSSFENITRLIDEFKIMVMLNHPSVLKAHGIFINDKKLSSSILLELCTSNLEQKVKKISRIQQVFFVYQIAQGMKYIHLRKIVHRNLNPSNILISEDGMIKIGGFENAKLMESENELNNDMHSFALVVYFVLSGGKNLDTKNMSDLKSFPLLTQQLIESCISTDIENQTTFEVICDVLEKSNFNLINLLQKETQIFSKMVDQYKNQIPKDSE